MEQLVWAIIMIIFTIFIALKNRARNRPNTNINNTVGNKQKTGAEDDRLSRYMEELLGIDRAKIEPQVRIRRETKRPLAERVTSGDESEEIKEVGQFESPLEKEHREKRNLPLHEEKEMYHVKFPWGTLSKKDLPNAIIFSEIIGPPISKRNGHRLF